MICLCWEHSKSSLLATWNVQLIGVNHSYPVLLDFRSGTRGDFLLTVSTSVFPRISRDPGLGISAAPSHTEGLTPSPMSVCWNNNNFYRESKLVWNVQGQAQFLVPLVERNTLRVPVPWGSDSFLTGNPKSKAKPQCCRAAKQLSKWMMEALYNICL
jgi:hypothetical protein